MINWLHVKQALRDWMRIRGDYDRFADSYGLTPEARELGLLNSIRYRQKKDRAIVVVSHFPRTFEHVQSLLEEQGIDYEISPLRLGPEFLLEQLPANRDRQATVLLTLAPTLDEAALDRPLPVQRKFKLSMMVLERHPKLEEDRRIETFARVCPCPVRLGYLLSLDDPVIRHCIHPTTIQVLRQLGLRDQELVTSRMVSQRIDRVLKRIAWPASGKVALDSSGNAPFISAEEWLSLLAQPPAATEKKPAPAVQSERRPAS
ncbi:MAG: hypothetical protein ACK6A8_02740 [Planctomycetota bacterium]